MSKKLQNPKEKLAKYLANIGFASRRNISNFIKNNEVRVNNKKSNHDSIIKDGDILEVNGEDFVVELNPPIEVLLYHKPTGQVCSNASTEKNDSVFMHLPPKAA